MNLFLARYAPLLIGAVVLLLLSLLMLVERVFPGTDILDRVEWMTYDWRVKSALEYPVPVSDKLAIVVLDSAALDELNKKSGFQWPLPRAVYGTVLKELMDQGAKTVAFDIFFQDRMRDFKEYRVKVQDGGEPHEVSSDDFFSAQLSAAGNALLAAPGGEKPGVLDFPYENFAKAAAGIGHARRLVDGDGVLRRLEPFVDDPLRGRIWLLGLELAGRELGLDFSRAVVEKRRIVIPDNLGGSRVIPLDEGGKIILDWSVRAGDRRMPGTTLPRVLGMSGARKAGKTIKPFVADRLVAIGSISGGNNIADIGPTPVGREYPLFFSHLNIADSLLMNRFVRTPSAWMEFALLAAMTFASGLLSWRLRALWATLAIATLASGYVWWAWRSFVNERLWLPIVLPVVGALVMTHASMVAFRFLLERSRRQKVRSLFGRIVSPRMVDLLITQPQASWAPSRRMMTVFFADIRGFTNFTDARRQRAEKEVVARGLSGEQARRCLDAAASEAMETINLYLTAVADTVKRRGGTLDKYIGDSVMAFWGAPLPNERHASDAVLAAMDAQRAVGGLNTERAAENQRRIFANTERKVRGLDALPDLEILQIGIGLNSGMMTVGFMGSPEHLSNFTAFGHDVNIAARLQDIADPGTIIVGEPTQQEAVRQEPELAPNFMSQGPTVIKGIAQELPCFRVLWTGMEGRTSRDGVSY